MQKRRVITLVIGAVLCLGVIAVAQDDPRFQATAENIVREQSGVTTFSGNVVLTINGVVVRADRAVIRNDDVALEGNVHVTLPKPIYTADAMRKKISQELTPYIRDTPRIDTPIPPPWQPPARNQR